MELYRKVRLAGRAGTSKRAAARDFGVSRESVRKMLAFSVPPGSCPSLPTCPRRRHPVELEQGVEVEPMRAETGPVTGTQAGAAAPRGEVGQKRPDPEVVTKPPRRRFTAEYRLWTVEEADRCTGPDSTPNAGRFRATCRSWHRHPPAMNPAGRELPPSRTRTRPETICFTPIGNGWRFALGQGYRSYLNQNLDRGALWSDASHVRFPASAFRRY